MRRSVRAVLLVVGPLVLAACGADGTADPRPRASSQESKGNDATFPRAISHAMGETEIPARPQRVVVLDTGELDSVTALGLTPVGAVRAPVNDGLLDYLEDNTRTTELVGTISDVNLEAVASLRPDLILSSKLRHEQIYDELSGIAPTVFTERVGVVWKDNLLVHAEALGLERLALPMLSDYEARAAALGNTIRQRRGSLPTISVVRFLGGETRLYQKASFIGTVLEDIGLPRPPAQDVDAFAAEIAAEQLEQADADVMFTAYYGPVDETTKPELVANPLWANLSAVESGNVHEVPDDHWMLGIGIQAANKVLDDIEHLLVG